MILADAAENLPSEVEIEFTTESDGQAESQTGDGEETRERSAPTQMRSEFPNGAG